MCQHRKKHSRWTYLLNSKLLIGLDLDLAGLLPSLLGDERDLGSVLLSECSYRRSDRTHHLVHLGLDLRVIEGAGT